MIVFDLICSDPAHQFEGWFSSSKDFEDQKANGLLECPICGSQEVSKAVMAPNVPAKANQQPSEPKKSTELPQSPVSNDVSTGVAVPKEYQELVGKMAKAQEKLLADSKWVGDDFADRARDMHYGEADSEQIHGTATEEEAQDLTEEGIGVTPLPLPVVPPKAKN